MIVAEALILNVVLLLKTHTCIGFNRQKNLESPGLRRWLLDLWCQDLYILKPGNMAHM